ncbi:MAG: MFS transporter [Galactobacter sp.]|uniref:MFS transporter n=1 Tax=Galactobacter sp. TaxID=2676125 RepID=UPI0025B9329E|nr:MFS transporter [Galactobacter sp.]
MSSPSGAPSALTSTPKKNSAGKVVFATFIGSAIEWYDFFLYAACAALVFGPQFFPAGNDTAAQLGAFATFTFGFIARPLGGIIAGHLGDRIGRKKMLVLSLYLMGAATVLVGCVPNFAAIGVWAPILLVILRLAQGLGVGAEWGGAATMAIENAPANRKALFGAMPTIGLPAGILLSNLMLIVLQKLTGENFLEWGWRIAFLFSIVLVVVGQWARRALEESPVFEQSVKEEPTRAPLLQILRHYPLPLLLTIFISGIPSIGSYIAVTWSLSWGTTDFGYSSTALLWIGITCSALQMIMVPLLSAWADRIGLTFLVVLGGALMIVTAFVFIAFFSSGNILLAGVGTILIHASTSFAWAAVPPLLTRSFPDSARYTGISMAYQFGAIIGGGFAPIIATSLIASTGQPYSVAVYVSVAAAIMVIAALLLTKFRVHQDTVR